MKKLFLIFNLLISVSFPQKFSFSESIGNFDNASSFYISSNGFIYITDKDNDEVAQLDTLGNLLKDVGGFGWNQSQFDEPIDVFADPLSVYVTDKNNHRIQRFDRKLNFISQLYTRENDNSDARFGYPNGCVVSSQGDLYVLDSENKRVIKFDLFGNYELHFGGIDAGEFSLQSPSAISISSNGIVFVADDKILFAFDQFGNGLLKIRFDEAINSIEIIFDRMILTTKDKIFFSNTNEEEIEFQKLELENETHLKIVSALLFNEKIYVLTQKNILVFSPVVE
ncbi:MAG: NHL repeat-containing protein [Ignavibacterium sp.]|uniref:NHL repeat-containing protein n=1 Tax=Ignavibacterium sp. TaxID=2651167 RepID=UPI00404A7D4C